MQNPFLDPSFKIRWSELTPATLVPSVELGIERAEARLAAIEADTSTPTFANTFLALEESTEELNRAWSRVTHLQSVADNPELREAHNAALPKVSAFFAKIPLRPRLWVRLKAFAELPEASGLSPIRARFVSETVAEFREAGADLPPEGRARLEAIQTELSQLTQKFSENVLDATNAWQLVVTEESKLAGLPAQAKARALAQAKAKGLATDEKPAWRFTLHQPSLEPFMTYLEDAGLREEMWRGSASVGAAAPHDNTGLIVSILKLRTEKAKLLGKKHFADLVLSRRMAKTGDKALSFIEDMRRRCAGAFQRECRELEEWKATETGAPAGRLAPWELLYRAERLRKADFDFDEEQLRPYFPMDRVMSGLLELARRVFGIRVSEKTGEEAASWNPEVKYYDMFDSKDRHIGSFYADWYPRESKRGGAWMGPLITGGPQPDGSRAPHLGYLCGNMTPPSPGKPALLNHREVQTVFHEYGHLIHHLLGEVEIKSMSGTNVAWDFVELPSQIMENWCWEREGLDLFARHHETGQPIPEELFAKMTAAKNFRSAAGVTRQAAQAEMDLLLHMHPDDFLGAADVEPALRAAISPCLVPTEPPAPTIIKRFTHLFSDPVGYAAGYYSYKWAEVLDADAFTRFRKEGIFNERVGREFVQSILSRGNSADPAELFREFMGRDPNLNALLERSGLAT
ncbi:MAG TPA: M3 family metallopeptidase [Opitutaceae bacterium]|jgi:oligopeptidase A|nr:M3 family metallopeptidase [Opitutaceae bacterium]